MLCVVLLARSKRSAHHSAFTRRLGETSLDSLRQLKSPSSVYPLRQSLHQCSILHRANPLRFIRRASATRMLLHTSLWLNPLVATPSPLLVAAKAPFVFSDPLSIASSLIVSLAIMRCICAFYQNGSSPEAAEEPAAEVAVLQRQHQQLPFGPNTIAPSSISCPS